MTSYNNNGTFIAVPAQVNVTGNSNGTDTANLYDDAGSNALVAQGNTATLTRSTNRVSVSQFGNVLAYQTQGTNDTVHQQAVDFALQLIGNWTSD